MKQLLIVIFFATTLSTNLLYGQNNSGRSTEPTPQEIEERKREIAEKREELIKLFLSTLEGDDFQKQIVGQYLDSYIDEKIAVMSVDYKRYEDKVRANKTLKENHFKDLEDLISENDMAAIQQFIDGKFDEKEAKKQYKKKNKND